MLRFHLKLIAVLPLLATLALAQFGVPLNRDESRAQPARIRELVGQYCRLDYDGVRLEPENWPKMQSVVSWRTNPDFPVINVISRYTIDEQPVESRSKYQITVHYRLLGRFTMGEAFSKEVANSTEDVTFTIAQVSGNWRITDVEPNYPHPSRAAMLKWLNGNLAKAPDNATKTIYEDAIHKLQTPTTAVAPSQ
jgi:hypothetical protein